LTWIMRTAPPGPRQNQMSHLGSYYGRYGIAAGSLRVLFHRDTTSENDSPGRPRQGRAGAVRASGSVIGD